MSHYTDLDGRQYSNSRERDAANKEIIARRAREEAAITAKRLRDIERDNSERNRRIDKLNLEITSLSRDNATFKKDISTLRTKQNELAYEQNRIKQNVVKIDKEQKRLREVQQQLKIDMENRFDEVHCRIDKNWKANQKTREELQEHINFVDKEFTYVFDQMQKGFDVAEERRRVTQEKLEESISFVDQKFENYKDIELQKQNSQNARAEIMINMATEILNLNQKHYSSLHLGEEASSLRNILVNAKSLKSTNAAASLATASAAYSEALTLTNRVTMRKAEIQASKDWISDQIKRMDKLLIDTENADIFYKTEISQIKMFFEGLLNSVTNGSLDNYSRLEIYMVKHEKMIDELEEIVGGIAIASPHLKELAIERSNMAANIFSKLKIEYGPLANHAPNQSFEVDNDPKTPLVIPAEFVGGNVTLKVGIDGKVSIDGYGHDSNQVCQQRAQNIIRALEADNAAVLNSQVDTQNRTQSVASASARATDFTSVRNRLSKLAN